MKRFFYKVRQLKDGNLLEGYIQAQSKQEAVMSLKKEQYLIIEISERRLFIDTNTIKKYWQRRKINSKVWIILCRQLAILLSAGTSLVDSLQILADEFKFAQNEIMAEFLDRTIAKLNEGKSLSDIWQTQRATLFYKNMPSAIISSLKVAEHTGLLAENLIQVADFLSKIDSEKKKLRQICIYPMFLLLLLSVVITIMIFFVLPIFAEIFSKMHLQLPFLTKMILTSGIFIRDNWEYILAVGILFSIILFKNWQNDIFRLNFYKMIFLLPAVGELLEKIYLLQISRQLVFLLSSGISIDESLAIIISGMNKEDNICVLNWLKSIRQNIHRGIALHRAFKMAGIKNVVFLGLLNVGEQTGMVANNLAYSVDFLTKEVDRFIDEFMKLLEPILMIIVGIIIGTFVLAIVLPLFDMASGLSL